MCPDDDRRDEGAHLDEPQRVGVLKVLVIDDDEMIRDVAKQMIIMLGYEVVCVASGSEGVKYYETHKDEIDIVILDLKMPEMDGTECYRALTECDPELNLILSSAYVPEDFLAELREAKAIELLPKPYTISEMSEAIAGILSSNNELPS